jgi:hypothetical protein
MPSIFNKAPFPFEGKGSGHKPSGGKDFHPTALTEPYVNLSIHTALHIPSQMYDTLWMYQFTKLK